MQEKQLLESCLRGEKEEFKKIVDRYSAQAMAMALNILRNREDAEDACQEAFVQVYRNLQNFDFKKSFKNWFFTILYHRCLDQLKKKRSFTEFFKKTKNNSYESASNPPSNQLEQTLSQNLLSYLSPKERTVLYLWANEGYTAEEIGEILGCASSTARVYLFHARRKIKALLEKKNVLLPNY